jgi:hypothetical protein
MPEDAQKRIQEKLGAARQLLIEAGKIADEENVEYVEFMGLTHEATFGWFKDDELQEASDWNPSSCVIGSVVARHGHKPPDGWQESSSCYQDW